jgi:UDP-glucose:(heptosyl)LPS alpha-1,3-glucosyltransferase
VLFVGMNFEVKGLDAILAALAKARTKANVRLLVVGRGNERKYGALARSLGVAEAVTFAGTQTASIERYYRAADVFIMLSAFDTFGMVVLEAMAAGLPVIVSGKVGAKDLVADGENGFVVSDPRDTDTAAARLSQLLDTNRCEAMSAAARQQAESHDWDVVVKALEVVYQNVLGRKAGRAMCDW